MYDYISLFLSHLISNQGLYYIYVFITACFAFRLIAKIVGGFFIK